MGKKQGSFKVTENWKPLEFTERKVELNNLPEPEKQFLTMMYLATDENNLNGWGCRVHRVYGFSKDWKDLRSAVCTGKIEATKKIEAQWRNIDSNGDDFTFILNKLVEKDFIVVEKKNTNMLRFKSTHDAFLNTLEGKRTPVQRGTKYRPVSF